MDNSELVHYKNLLLAKQQELSNGKVRGDTIQTPSETHGDLLDMAASESTANLQLHLRQSGSKLLRAVEDALARIRQERFGICESCGEPISKARLQAVPWAQYCRDCTEQQDQSS